MDARLDVYRIMNLKPGEAHVIRNAGGVMTEDALRSLVISQRLLGTTEIVLVQHTDCGMQKFKDEELGDAIAADVGYRPLFAFRAFPDLTKSLQESMSRIRNDPFLLHRNVRGYVYDVETDRLDEVRADSS